MYICSGSKVNKVHLQVAYLGILSGSKALKQGVGCLVQLTYVYVCIIAHHFLPIPFYFNNYSPFISHIFLSLDISFSLHNRWYYMYNIIYTHLSFTSSYHSQSALLDLTLIILINWPIVHVYLHIYTIIFIQHPFSHQVFQPPPLIA